MVNSEVGTPDAREDALDDVRRDTNILLVSLRVVHASERRGHSAKDEDSNLVALAI